MPTTRAASARNAEPSVRLSPRGVTRLQSRHPWVYRSDIIDEKNVPPGSLVRVHDQRGKFLGSALYSSSSQIAIRMISHGSISDLPAMIAKRIREAIAYRKDLVTNTDACRLVFSEADFLPGLIIDRYNDVLTLQILTQAMDTDHVREAILKVLMERRESAPVQDENESQISNEPGAHNWHLGGIAERVDPRIRELEKLPPRPSQLLWGDKSATIINMNGIRFQYDALEGQKTGAFLDQRENYAAAAAYAHGEALDAFCYQGGFALHVAARCSTVTGVDSSRPALEMAEKNATLNSREIEWIEANAFDLLRDYAAANRRYDTIILDPPAFAKTKRDVDKALGGYKELNLRAMKMLRPGGILVTCSCSFHVTSPEFYEVVAAAARDVHRSLRIVENRGAARDHPTLLNIPETGYLKCSIFSVSN